MTTPPPNDPLVQHVERMKDLVLFSVSEEYFAVRKELKVAIAQERAAR